MTIRHKNHHLLERNGIWHFNRRLPGGMRHQRYSLKTRNIEEARRKRDRLLTKWDEFANRVAEHSNVVTLRRQYLGLFHDDEREIFEDLIIEKSEELADQLGTWKELKSLRPTEETSTKAQKPVRFWQTATGRLTPLIDLTPAWLETLENKKTRADYRRGMDILSKQFAATEEITWDKARAYLRLVEATRNVSGATIRKWVSGYINFWEHYEKDVSVWRNHKLQKTRTIAKRAWSSEEVAILYSELGKQEHWLQLPLWIAAHTGARMGAICALTYNSENQTILFPAQKNEARNRLIPAHPAILSSLGEWVANPKSISSVSGSFGEFKKELGFGEETDFHSFRRTFITQLENLGCPEAITADIVGHKKQTITYGLYSGGSSLELMRDWIRRVQYPLTTGQEQTHAIEI